MEIQESKEDMANKDFADRYAKHTTLVLRFTKMLHGKGHIVHGDSAFTSVETACAMLEHGTYYTGLLKTASRLSQELPQYSGMDWRRTSWGNQDC